MMTNIVLIGMPGCGKSTVGVLLAKSVGKAFIDTDVVLQAKEGKKLQPMIEEIGIDAFLEKEQNAILSLDCEHTVIATGGSVVYGAEAMKHLHRNGVVVYIKLPYNVFRRRLSNLATRGVTLKEGQTLFDLYNERIPLYEATADLVCESEGCEIEDTVERIASLVNEYCEAKHGV